MADDELDVEEESEEEVVSVTYDIASYPSDFTLLGISQIWQDKDILIPDYQREFVWSIRQSSLLIDSFLCGTRMECPLNRDTLNFTFGSTF